MTFIRDITAHDMEAVRSIALRTADGGTDASGLFLDPDLPALVYATPYVMFEPALALVLEDEGGVAGYCVGALDTRSFERVLGERWWPGLRRRYPLPAETSRAASTNRDASMIELIHNPPRTPDWLAEEYPSHLHINLLPRLQGRGCGRRLLDAWRGRARGLGSAGFHLGVDPANLHAIGFYRAYGLERLHPPMSDGGHSIWFGTQNQGAHPEPAA